VLDRPDVAADPQVPRDLLHGRRAVVLVDVLVDEVEDG
jgi:hypothetical protein